MFTRFKFLFFLILASALLNCSWNPTKWDNFEVRKEATTKIPAGTLLDQLVSQFAFVGFEGFDFSQSQEIQNKGIPKDHIESVHMKSFRIQVQSPDSGNLNFLKSIQFYVQADGLPKIPIAWSDSIPLNQRDILLHIDGNAELAPYVKKSSLSITSEGKGERPAVETELKAIVIFDVDAQL